jgi:hypothetical protein
MHLRTKEISNNIS